MKTGPNRRVVASGVFPLLEISLPPLGKFRRVDFSELRDAELDVLDVYRRYLSQLQAEQLAPDLVTTERKVGNLLSAIEALRRALRAFQCLDADARSRHEFNAAMNEILFDVGLAQEDTKDFIEEIGFPLGRLATHLRVIKTEVAKRHEAGELLVASSAAVRAQFYRELDRVLIHHAISDGLGEKSLMVALIMRLEGSESGDKDNEPVRRKQIAREVKRAVNPQKGG